MASKRHATDYLMHFHATYCIKMLYARKKYFESIFSAEMFFFDGRQMNHNCFQYGLRSDVGASFESAIQKSEGVETYEEISEVLIPRMGDLRVKA